MILLDTTRRLVNTSQDMAPGEMRTRCGCLDPAGAAGLGPSKKLLNAYGHLGRRLPTCTTPGTARRIADAQAHRTCALASRRRLRRPLVVGIRRVPRRRLSPRRAR